MVHAINSASHATQAVTNASQGRPVAQSQPNSADSATAATAVKISSAAQAALQEAVETAAQTAKEASSGDRQAQRLLAREAAARKAGD